MVGPFGQQEPDNGSVVMNGGAVQRGLSNGAVGIDRCANLTKKFDCFVNGQHLQ